MSLKIWGMIEESIKGLKICVQGKWEVKFLSTK